MSKSFELNRRAANCDDRVEESILVAVAEAQRRFETVNEDIVRKAHEVTHRSAEAVDGVEGGLNVNSLGTLQSAGPDLDRLCAVRQERLDALRELVHLARRLYVDLDNAEVF